MSALLTLRIPINEVRETDTVLNVDLGLNSVATVKREVPLNEVVSYADKIVWPLSSYTPAFSGRPEPKSVIRLNENLVLRRCATGQVHIEVDDGQFNFV